MEDSYGPGDAEILYAMVRWSKPTRIIELGAGNSTIVMARAATANAREGSPVRLRSYDPYPADRLLGLRDVQVIATGATDVPLDLFRELDRGDVLFVDSTHTVKLGSDVNFVILDVLPVLRPGVIVHFHDIFLPWEYPRHWAETEDRFWTEQYLLYAFLAFNPRYEVLLPCHAVAREHPEALAAAVPRFGPASRPTAFWLRVVQG
jgi:hypothetical protein